MQISSWRLLQLARCDRFCYLCHQIEKQRQYLQRIWRDDRKGSIHDYGLLPNYVPKHLVSLGGSRQVNTAASLTTVDSVSSKTLLFWFLNIAVFTFLCHLCSPALANVFLLELHPSLCLASAVYQGLVQAHSELCQLHQASSVSEKLLLRQKVLQQALQTWNSLASLGISYSSQIQKDVGFYISVFYSNQFT